MEGESVVAENEQVKNGGDIKLKESQKSKVLLVSLPGLNTGCEPIFPLGIGYLLSAIRQDRPVQAVHYQVFEHATQQLPEIISAFQPEIVGLTCSTFNRGNVRTICTWLRKNHPHIKIILGGVHVSFLAQQALRDYVADCVVIGEGELTFRELCDALDKDITLAGVKGIAFLDGEKFVTTEPREVVRNLDDLPLPDYSYAGDLMRRSGMGFVITSRGCPVRCSFCSTSSYWGQKVRTNSPQRVVDEMEALVATYGVKKIFFHDDTFNLGMARVRDICAEITSRGLNVEWGVSCRVNPVSQEMIDMMVAAGCRHICWGIESGSKEMLERIDKKITQEQISKAFEICRKHLGTMSVGAFTMVGNPGESEETIAESIQFINTLHMTDQPSTSILYILPGTKLYAELLVKHPELEYFWVHNNDTLQYTLENTLDKLNEWATRISQSGAIVFLDRNKHFWNNVLFGNIPQPTMPDLSFCSSELDHVIPPEIKDDEFYFLIQTLAREENIHTVLEIGSSAGGGSTEAFVTGLGNNRNHPRLYCMEVSKPRFAELQNRYADKDFVKCYNVSSVPISKFPSETELSRFYSSTRTALNDYPLERVVGWLRQDIDYVQTAGVPADGIERIKRENGINIFDMVLIDGSEFTGNAELEEVYGAKLILLDDINGFKNHHNRQRLLADANYSLLHENWKVRNGYSVFRRSDTVMPIHFFTIVLNGEPFIRYHIDILSKLPSKWHWHIVEGVADLKHDTAWSVASGGRITDRLHNNGLSNDGTSDYLDALARKFPDNVTVYRKLPGQFWDGKLEMVNAPLQNINERCLLWQIDVDELWTADQLTTARTLFMEKTEKTAAYYYCNFFVGPDLVITSRDTYGNHTAYEWLRTWRFEPGNWWTAHEPPRLCSFDRADNPTDIASINPLRHAETESNGLIFQHLAYVMGSQLSFKEEYYGYRDAVSNWERLQKLDKFPALLREFFPWVNDNSTVDTASACGISPLIQLPTPRIKQKAPLRVLRTKILWVRSDSIGDNILASSMLEHIRKQYPQAVIIAVCQQHIAELYEVCPYIDSVIPFDKTRLERDQFYRDIIIRRMQAVNADLALNSVYSREPINDLLVSQCGARERIALDGDLCNISREKKQLGDKGYTELIHANTTGILPELERHQEFLQGIGVNAPPLAPCVWTTPDDAHFAESFFTSNNLKPESTIALFLGAQWEIKLYGHLGEALAELCRQKSFTVIGLGSSTEAALTQQHLDTLGVPTINLCGKVTLRQTAEMLRRCRLAVGVDSALAHMASAVGTPNVIVLGGGHFGRFMPYSPLTSVVCIPLECYGCNWECRYDRPYCIQAISPEIVLNAINESLQRNSEKPRIHAQQGTSWEQMPGRPSYKETSLNLIKVPAYVFLHKFHF